MTGWEAPSSNRKSVCEHARQEDSRHAAQEPSLSLRQRQRQTAAHEPSRASSTSPRITHSARARAAFARTLCRHAAEPVVLTAGGGTAEGAAERKHATDYQSLGWGGSTPVAHPSASKFWICAAKRVGNCDASKRSISTTPDSPASNLRRRVRMLAPLHARSRLARQTYGKTPTFGVRVAGTGSGWRETALAAGTAVAKQACEWQSVRVCEPARQQAATSAAAAIAARRELPSSHLAVCELRQATQFGAG